MYPHPEFSSVRGALTPTTTPSACGVITELDFASVEVEDRIETLDSQSDPPGSARYYARGWTYLQTHPWAVAPGSSLYNSPIHQHQLALTATVLGSTVRMIKSDNFLRQADDTEVPLVD